LQWSSANDAPAARRAATQSTISDSLDMPVDTTIGRPVAAIAPSSSWLVRSADATLNAGMP
jgi:hypothetical protein